MLLALTASALVMVGCTAAPDAASEVNPECDGKCDEKGPATARPSALIVVPRYRGKPSHESDTNWALEHAGNAGHFLFEQGWEVDILPVDSLDAFVAELDARAGAGEQVDALVTVGHGDQRGLYFDYEDGPGGDREWLQAGWDWYGPGTILEPGTGSGEPRIEGVRQLAFRLQRIVRPTGHIVFVGCRIGRGRAESQRDVATDAYKAAPPTPFRRVGGTYYDSYAHVIADLTERVVYTSRIRDNLCFTTEAVASIHYGGLDGTGGLPDWWVRVAPSTLHAEDPLPGYRERCDGTGLCTLYGAQRRRPDDCGSADGP